jgi:hypothetical protein
MMTVVVLMNMRQTRSRMPSVQDQEAVNLWRRADRRLSERQNVDPQGERPVVRLPA